MTHRGVMPPFDHRLSKVVSESTTFFLKRVKDHLQAVGLNDAGDSLMLITPQSREDPSEDSARSSSVSDVTPTSLVTGILLLENDPLVLSDRSSLLRRCSYHVTTAHNPSDLFHLRETTGVSLAIIGDRLGATTLGLAAQAIRRSWPLARILILGKPEFVIEDYLYDEAIEYRFVDSNLLSTIEKLCHPFADRGRDGGLFIVPPKAGLTTVPGL